MNETEQGVNIQPESSTTIGAASLGFTALFSRLRTQLTWAALAARRLDILLFACLVLYGGWLLNRTAFAVRATDTSGYANIAYSLLHGPIAQPIPLRKELDLPLSYATAFLRTSYLWVPDTDKMVPFYTVGFPLHLTLFSLVFGWLKGLYLVSPIFATLSVWLLYLLSRALGLSRAYAVGAAAILAFCPPFVAHALHPMSDVTATFWAMAAIYAAVRSQRRETWSLLAGAAFGIGFLVRPTNMLLLLPLAFSLRLNWRSLLFFGLGGFPFSLIFAAYNNAAYGHPLVIGYGVADYHKNEFVYTLEAVKARFNHYVYWFTLSLSPLVWLSWLATPFQRRLPWRNRALLVSWFGAFFVFYCFYNWYVDWVYTRFLLPGLPALILMLMLACRGVADWLSKKLPLPSLRPHLALASLLLMLGTVFGFEQYLLRHFDLFNSGVELSQDRAATRRMKRYVPEHALVMMKEMTGTWKFYADRAGVRYDLVPTEQLQEIMRRGTAQGRPLYAFLMSFEIEDARQKIQRDWVKIDEVGHFSLWRIDEGK